jgi:hypothetical protein
MEHFWPSLPVVIPNSEGMPMWWDIMWWVFQIVIMSTLLITLRNWAVKADRKMKQQMEAEQHVTGSDSTMGV